MTPRRHRPSRWLAGFALGLTLALPAAAEMISTLRVRLHPYAAAAGELPAAALAQLEALTGGPLTLTGSTRTGALEFALPVALRDDDFAKLVSRLREDRSVLWAEAAPAGRLATKSLTRDPRGDVPGRRLLLRLKNGVLPDWQSLGERFSGTIGQPVAAVRQVGEVWVLTLFQSQSPDRLAKIAEILQQDPAVQYADPVRRVYASRVPADPQFPDQWSLSEAHAGVNAPIAWDVQTGTIGTTVAVIDTGILPHPDIAGRLLPGYDFITDPERARDGDGRDANPRDEGDWLEAGDCGGAYPQDSFFHGLFVAGIIGAATDNGIGIAGLDWSANILPVRALGRCGGTFEDVLEAMLWASGVPIAGIPANPNPAKVINLSLGGYGGCAQAIQEAVDDAMSLGSVIVASAGNESADVTYFAPANCSGVITVSAHQRSGDRTSYSNFGPRVDVSAPGGEGEVQDRVLSLSYTGTTTPGEPSYRYGIGTSFAAPHVAGTVSLMLARNRNLTPGKVLSILQGTVRDFPIGTQCGVGHICGTGLLDAGVAVTSTIPALASAPLGSVPVVEYYRADFDHYFVTADPFEMQLIDQGYTMFKRTGNVFYAYLDPLSPFTPPNVHPVCRFYAAGLINSHFMTASPIECQYMLANWAGVWNLEVAAAFYIEAPDSLGNCLPARIPIYRFFNNRQDANHRLTPDLSDRRMMINRAWVPEGSGPNAAVFCSPI